ncbi:MAG: hypothetical protein K0R57_3093 [Paenibacillaceae bacterium]|nr:hypothetical protein [Paenibacillaceae bacterium]
MFTLDRGSRVIIQVNRQSLHAPALLSAAQDLARDLADCIGCLAAVEEGGGPIIGECRCIIIDDTGELLDGPVNGKPLLREQYAYTVDSSSRILTIMGTDHLGALWGIYAISEKILGLNPFASFLGAPCKQADSVSIPASPLSASPLFTYRGWFFNDEDFITGWREPAGTRPVDYLFYSRIMNHRTIDEIIEAALRNRVNFLIPSSFQDIDCPEDEETIRRITGRGLYISQHHIEPLGVSHFAFRNYFKAQGREEQPSYYSRPEVFDEIWRHYVRKWAKYKNVIWQVGLRGDVDRAVWKSDPSVPQSMEAAGKLISGALAHQLGIISEETGVEAPPATMTLWMEGAMLYREGYLKVPDNVIIVFANVPARQEMNTDFALVPRKKDRGYGVYHHNGFYYRGPHVAQGHHPEKIRRLLQQVADKGDTAYALSNVQNLREVVLGTGMFAKFAFEGVRRPAAEGMKDWCNTIMDTKGEQLLGAYEQFFASYLPMEGDSEEAGHYCGWLDGELREAGIRCLDKYPKGLWHRYDLEHVATLYPDQPLSAEDRSAIAAQTKLNNEVYPSELAKCCGNWTAVRSSLEKLCSTLAGWERTFVSDNLLVQAVIMEGMSIWALQIIQAVKADQDRYDPGNAERILHGAQALQVILEQRRLAEHGKFANWYSLDHKFDIEYMHKATLAFYDWFSARPEERVLRPEERGTAFDYINHYHFNFGL